MIDNPETKVSRVAYRGFASMTRERRVEVARSGGIKAVQLGTGHRWTPEEASAAGRIGGKISKRGRKKAESEA